MDIEIIQATWRRIDMASSTKGVIASELTLVETAYGYPLLTIDDQKFRHLLLPIPDDLQINEDKASSGIHILETKWGLNNQTQHVVDIVCLKPHLNAVFDLVILDIFKILKDNSLHPDRAAHRTLNRWRELLAREHKITLTASELIGLYGELWFLRELVKLNSNSLSLWRGPFGERFDFYSGKTAVEVKTTRQRKGKNLIIHGHDQLEEPPNGDLYLCRIQVEIAPNADETIHDIIADLQNLESDQYLLQRALAQLGFPAGSKEEYLDYAFNVLEVDVYLVNDKFPRITKTSFKNDNLPSGIVSLEYSIDLTSQPPFPISEEERENLITRLIGEIT